MEIIPAIDIIDGKAVRLSKGDYTQKKIYNEHPLEVAKAFADGGFNRLHLVDLDGAKSGTIANLDVLKQISTHTNLQIDFSGGISNKKALEQVFDSGATFAAIGSIAVKDPNSLYDWLHDFGTEKFIIGADVLDENVMTRGWTESSSIDVFTLINQYLTKGVTQYFCTDISKDGMLEGTAITLYKKILERIPNIQLIASGGVSSVNDLEALRLAGCSGAIIGKAIYEGRITLKELSNFYLSQ